MGNSFGHWTCSNFLFRISENCLLIWFPNCIQWDAFKVIGNTNSGLNHKNTYLHHRNSGSRSFQGRCHSLAMTSSSETFFFFIWRLGVWAMSPPSTHAHKVVASAADPGSSQDRLLQPVGGAGTNVLRVREETLFQKSRIDFFHLFGQNKVKWQPLNQSLAKSIGIATIQLDQLNHSDWHAAAWTKSGSIG